MLNFSRYGTERVKCDFKPPSPLPVLAFKPFSKDLETQKKSQFTYLKSKIVFFDALLTRRQVSPALVCQKKKKIIEGYQDEKKKYCNISLINYEKQQHHGGISYYYYYYGRP